MNLAKKVKYINIIHCIFCNGYEKTFATLVNAQYYKVMFYTHLEAGSV